MVGSKAIRLHLLTGNNRNNVLAEPQMKLLLKDQPKERRNGVKAETPHLGMIDLNLLRVFDAIMLHRSVRKASRVLSVTPSAVSHALSRLHESIGNERFT
jgi:pyruvate/2-oxoglutarate/acetoin dehydrogenase E1 component